MARTLIRGNIPGMGKRMFDLCLGGFAFAVLLPAMLLLALAIRLVDGGPVLFMQTRPGRDGKPFRMVKFRTMRAAAPESASASASAFGVVPGKGNAGEADAVAAVATDGARITRLGACLRATSLDELPELWNVVRGEMSLVGPRPLLMAYLPLYSAEQARRHAVRPGVTGWAQVSGRNNLSWEQQFALDVWYVDHWSNALDLSVLVRTVLAVLRRDGISAEGEATMPEFRGSAASTHVS